MSDLKKITTQFSHYFTGIFLSFLSGIISFPIFTRIFSVSEYGILNLVSSILLFTVALGKFGLQQASVRFYDEFKIGKRKANIKQFYSTLFFGSILISGIITFLYLCIIKFIRYIGADKQIIKILLFTVVLIFVRCITYVSMNFLRVEQKTKLYNLITILQKYLSLIISLLFAIYFIKGLYGFYAGMILAEIIIFTFLIYGIFKKRLIDFFHFSFSFLKESIKYGLPLIVFELAAVTMSVGDRFIIQLFSNSEMVGIYSAGYNLAEYIGFLFILPLELAIVPIYVSIWTYKGPDEVKSFLNKCLSYFLLLGFPVIFGLSAISRELILFLGTAKYFSSYKIIPFIITGIILFGTYNIFAAGLFIHKKTVLLSLLLLISGTVNIILNIILMPKMGIIGCALATLLAYLIFTSLVVFYAFRYLRFKINFVGIFSYLLCSVLMFQVIKNINVSNNVLNLFIKIGCGILVYSFLIILFDKDIRGILVNKVFLKKVMATL